MRLVRSLNRVVLRFWFAAEFTRFISQQPRPDLTEPVTVYGPQEVRVLIIGAGLGVGYGTRTAEDALPGQLATELHASLHRGIRVDTQVEIARPLRATVRDLLQRPALGYDLIIYTPAFGEAYHGHTAAWSKQLRALIAATQAGNHSPSLVLTGLPTPRVKRPIERIALEHATRVNQAIQVSAVSTSSAYAAAPTYATPSTYRIFDPDHYQQLAHSIAQTAATLLGQSQRTESPNPSTV